MAKSWHDSCSSQTLPTGELLQQQTKQKCYCRGCTCQSVHVQPQLRHLRLLDRAEGGLLGLSLQTALYPVAVSGTHTEHGQLCLSCCASRPCRK